MMTLRVPSTSHQRIDSGNDEMIIVMVMMVQYNTDVCAREREIYKDVHEFMDDVCSL